MDLDLTDTDIEILQDLQRNGDNVPGNISENIDRHNKHVSRCLSELQDKGLIENKGNGVYTLTSDGRFVARDTEPA